MTETIYEAIPVTYKGTQFRSKMEGRIARLLDNLDTYWEYEPITKDGYTPDFRIPDWDDGTDVWIEVKYFLYGTGLNSDADKIERFAKSHFIIIGGALPERQYINDWDSFVKRMNEISSKNCSGYNPYGLAPWNICSIKDDRALYMLVALKEGGIGLRSIYGIMDERIDQEKTLSAYYDASTFVFEAITEKQQETIEQLQDALSKQSKLKLNTEKGERKTARKQIVMKPSVKDGIEKMAWEHHLSFNEFIHQMCEKMLDGEITIE